jgi:hypothetical protein
MSAFSCLLFPGLISCGTNFADREEYWHAEMSLNGLSYRETFANVSGRHITSFRRAANLGRYTRITPPSPGIEPSPPPRQGTGVRQGH